MSEFLLDPGLLFPVIEFRLDEILAESRRLLIRPVADA